MLWGYILVLLRQMKFFLMVADCKSFSEAAEKTFMTQPAISHQIKMLEQDLGIALFERKSGRVWLTAAGEEFYGPCKRLVTETDALRAHMQEFSAPQRTPFVLAVVQATMYVSFAKQ